MDIGPYNAAADITTSDATDFALNATRGMPRAIYVGGAGIVAAVFQDGTVVNFTCVAGQVLPVRVKRINATNTTATLLRALYMV